MINMFCIRPAVNRKEDLELFYAGKNMQTYEKFVGGKLFTSGNWHEKVEDALNFLETEGYAIISVERADFGCDIITRL